MNFLLRIYWLFLCYLCEVWLLLGYDFMSISSKLLKFLIRFRYRVNITWLELLNSDWAKLIFPSHIALMDPVIMFAFLWEKKKLSPVVTESYYNKVLLKRIFSSIGAIPVPDLTTDKSKELDTSAIIDKIKVALDNNRNILLYPQWALARQGFQSIVGKKTAFYISQQIPKDTKILTVNIRWLWGSRSSRAWTWKSPNLALFILKWLLFVIANLFFFVPKRKVEIEIKDSTPVLHKVEKKWIDAFNQELEKIYNAKWEEKLNYLSGLCWYNTTKNHKEPDVIQWSIKDLKRTSFNWNTDISDDVLNRIINIIKKIKPEYSWKITIDTNLVLDCFFDSLDMAELKSTVQSNFSESSNPPLLDLKTVGDVAMMAIWKLATNEELKPCNWIEPKDGRVIYSHVKSVLKQDSTILDLMRETLKKDKSTSFCYDWIFWVQSRKDFVIKAYLIADLLKKMPWERIAIMLPSLSATSLLVVWCYLAKKIPVMLNWTQSNEAFSHCIRSQNVQVILTAKSFYQKIQTPRLKKYNMTFFEDVLKDISLIQKLIAVIKATRFKIPSNISKIAVVLFTSGSEELPKTVELTHENILQDILWTAWLVWLKMNDVELCFLPPFHSFGFILWIAIPLVTGVRVVFTPDPNDSKTIANLTEHTKTTFIASTPTFLNWIVQMAKDNQLQSLRFAVVWAEKCPKELFTKFSKKAPQATIIEWYGITECSPIIAVNPFKRNAKIKRWTVWLPILWESVKILDIDTNEEVSAKKEWMIFVRGLNMFGWYIDKKLESPFIEINWKQRYKTWDLWFLDNDWYLTISWRLKRFVKIAWEMISLPAIENVLSRKRKNSDWTECLAIESDENNWKVTLTLFSTENLDLKEVNSYLHEQWVTNLVSIDYIINLKEIPMLWTWKVDHVSLKKLLESDSKKTINKKTRKTK